MAFISITLNKSYLKIIHQLSFLEYNCMQELLRFLDGVRMVVIFFNKVNYLKLKSILV